MEKKKILIIDDECEITALLKGALEKTGRYSVFTANSAADGLREAKRSVPDLILLDLIMREMDGATLAQHIKEDKETRGMPIIFMTGIEPRQEEGASDKIIGGHRFLIKPFQIAEAVNCIEKALRKA